MATKTSFLELRLYENGIDFINKSMESFVMAVDEKEKIEYKYAILLLATGCELVLKSILEDVHPLFIKEDLDSSTDITVKAENLVGRINKIYSMELKKKRIHKLDEDNLISIREIRNNITHKEVRFEDENVPQKIYANTLFSLDRIVKDFKRLTLATQVKNWDYIVGIDLIQAAYYNSVSGITLNGIAVPCSFCSIKKLVYKNGVVECLHCGNKFANIIEAIKTIDDSDIIEELFLAFTNEKYKQGSHFVDCPVCDESNTAWDDKNDSGETIICFSCGPINSDICFACSQKTVITYSYDVNDEIEKVNYCFNCRDFPDSELCPNCYNSFFSLREKLTIDVKKPYKFYPQVNLKPSSSLFLEAELCPECHSLMFDLEKKGIIEMV